MVTVKRLVLISLCSLLGMTWPVMAIENVRVAGIFGKKAVLEIDGKRRVLATGERSPEGVTLLSVEGESIAIEYDGQREHISLDSEISGAFAQPTTREERFWPDTHGLYRTQGSIDGQPVTFIIDTGANQVAMNSGVASRLGIDYKAHGERGMAQTASDVVVVYRVILDSVQVGGLIERQVSAVVIEGAQPSEVLLGMTFLSRLDMAREGEVMKLKQK